LILPRRAGVAAAAAGGQDSVGVRCPAHAAAQDLLRALREPQIAADKVWGLAAPSANRFGRVSPTTAQHVVDEFGDQFHVLDAGACAVGIESTIVDCTRGVPVLLRPGSIGTADIQAACGLALAERPEQAAPRASGTLASHYAPNARVSLWQAKDLPAALAQRCNNIGANAGEATYAKLAVYAQVPLQCSYPAVLLRTMPQDPASVAHELFAMLREFDAQGVQEIWVQQPPPGAVWNGVRDRLQRASHRD
jgi:L-threonylcarbamoyladenylate synthase